MNSSAQTVQPRLSLEKEPKQREYPVHAPCDHAWCGEETIKALIRVAEVRDEDAGIHIARMGQYSGRIAAELGLPQEFQEKIAVASALHDIGRIGVPDAILFKTTPLTASEFEVIKLHTLIGYRILQDFSHPVLEMASQIALTHHERWDGTGYPHGLRGESIPMAGRIVMVADLYDALRSPRPCEEPFDHAAAVAIITGGNLQSSPSRCDPRVLAAFSDAAGDFEAIFDAHQDDAGSDRDSFGRVNKLLHWYNNR